jgi:cardiolipin synthase A/B
MRPAVLLLLAGLGCLHGCSSLPTIVPDLARPAISSMAVEGVRGPLSAQQSRIILERLRRDGKDLDVLDRHLALEEAVVGRPLSIGNQVTLLEDGPTTYQAMYAAIIDAKDHINMETYVMDDDEVGQRFAQALIEKQQQGIQVNLIRDSAGTFSTPALFFQKLIDSGVNVLEFNPLNPLVSRKEWTLNQRDHRKLLIVDGHTAFLGGINISSVYSGGSFSQSSRKPSNGNLAWRDTDLQLKGPVVAEFQKLFLSTWEKQKGPALVVKNYFPPPVPMGKQVVRAIGSSPDESFSAIYATLLSVIGAAEISVQLTNAYFVPDPQLLAVLESAAKRGVDVTLILPSETDSWLVQHAGHAYYTRLLKSGVRIYHRRGVILHSKTALIDGVWATVGSTNLDWRSFLHNDELNAVVLGAEFGQQVQAMFEKDLAASDEVVLVQWERRTLDQHFKELIAQLWEYWL